MTTLYFFFFLSGLLFSSPYWIWRAWKKRELGLTWARLGFTAWPVPEIRNSESETRNATLWIHAVSVGEVHAAQPLMAGIRKRSPETPMVLSVTTRTGLEVARNALKSTPDILGPLPFPLDLPWAVSRRIREIRPRAIIFIDTEIWPNLISNAAAKNVRLFLANGRISDKSFRQYRLIRRYLRTLFDRFTFFWMQSDLNAERILALGAPKDRVRVGGNLKIDAMTLALQAVSSSPQPPLDPPFLLAASTHPGEESIILAAAKAWKSQGRPFRLAIAPRHPERAGEVRNAIESCGFRTILRSAVRGNPSPTSGLPNSEELEVLLIDTIGELGRFFPQARLVFVGGSLVPKGGHNIFEPAAFGRPAIFGPHMENFREAEDALSGRGAVRVGSAAEFALTAEQLLFDRNRADLLGQKAKETFISLQGAADRISADLLKML